MAASGVFSDALKMICQHRTVSMIDIQQEGETYAVSCSNGRANFNRKVHQRGIEGSNACYDAEGLASHNLVEAIVRLPRLALDLVGPAAIV
jgi:hypothetical protein